MTQTSGNTREVAKKVVLSELAQMPINQKTAAVEAGIGNTSWHNVSSPTVSAVTLRKIEAYFRWPRLLLDYIIDGNAERIADLPSKVEDHARGLEPDLRRSILNQLEDAANPRNRRQSDRKRA